MRRATFVLALALLSAPPAAFAKPTPDELARAYQLDQQGVRAYREGRYKEGLRDFDEAFKLGGPPSELWNMARCYLRLDQPQEAADTLERYLAQPGISAQEKNEGTAQLDELRHRRSLLTVASSPTKSTVYLDGKRSEPAGVTPFSVPLVPGLHTVEVEQPGYRRFSEDVDAKWGRPIVIDAQLVKDNGQPAPAPVPASSGAARAEPSSAAPETAAPSSDFEAPRHVTAAARAGLVFSKLGSYSESARLGFAFGLAYWIIDTPKGIFGIGLHVDVASDSWGNTVNAPPGAIGCPTAIAQNESATEVGFYGVGVVGYRISERFRLGAEGGLGATDYTADSLGGDVFVPTCHLNPLQVAVHAGIDVSYAIVPRLRAVAAPTFALHPAYAGTRAAPVDASGAWTRIGVGLGLALDL